MFNLIKPFKGAKIVDIRLIDIYDQFDLAHSTPQPDPSQPQFRHKFLQAKYEGDSITYILVDKPSEEISNYAFHRLKEIEQCLKQEKNPDAREKLVRMAYWVKHDFDDIDSQRNIVSKLWNSVQESCQQRYSSKVIGDEVDLIKQLKSQSSTIKPVASSVMSITQSASDDVIPPPPSSKPPRGVRLTAHEPVYEAGSKMDTPSVPSTNKETNISKTPPVSKDKPVVLKVKKVSRDELPDVRKILFAWMEQANNKILSVRTQDYRQHNPDSIANPSIEELCKYYLYNERPAEEEVFGDLVSTCSYISLNITRDDCLLVCEDSSGKIQSIALYDPIEGKLKGLVSHPDNIQSAINQNIQGRVKGAGTALMLYCMKESIKLNLPLKLDSVGHAITYYERFNFTYKQKAKRTLCTPMELAIDKMGTQILRLESLGFS